MSVTMKDIAMLAGVSRQAVAAALSGSGGSRVSAENLKKIRRLAQELNYVPNMAARGLNGCPTKTIGMLCSQFSSDLVNARFNEIGDMLQPLGYNLLSCQFGFSNFPAARGLTELLSRGVDGIIIGNSIDRRELEENQRVPYVYCGVDNFDGFDVAVDSTLGVRLAAEHLLEHGRRHLCYICPQRSIIDDIKIKGMSDALAAAGIDPDEGHVLPLRQLGGDADALIAELGRLKVDAALCSNDYVGAKLIAVLTRNGIGVPADIAVIGYDGYTFSEFAPVPMTTVAQPIRRQAEIAVDILTRRVAAGTLRAEPENIRLEPKLYLGASCGCAQPNFGKMFTINTFPMLEKNLKMNFDINL